MEITLNGKPEEITPQDTIHSLLERHQLRPEQVVVEINEHIVKRDKFQSTPFRSGDRIEILTFVGGD